MMEEVLLHPDNDQPLQGFQIPDWHLLLDVAVKGASAFPELRTIGWDIGLTEQGPSIIEGNARYGVEHNQILLGRGLKAYFEKTLARDYSG